ncbi:MAG: hypothetical protein JW781_08095 [Deltaproteobacteria bacterium]|nr:hypothetical protein [Candidatus Anaeroferrophillacea bacterium]
MRPRNRLGKIIVITLLLTGLGILPAAADSGAVVARGADGIAVYEADLAAMRQASPNFQPTPEALLKATVRTVLFARRAAETQIECPGLDRVAGFDRNIVLGSCWERELMKGAKLHEDAVLSWYRAHWRQFTDENGELAPLDDDLGHKIRNRILVAKKKTIVNEEYGRLCDRYQIEFVEGR